MTLPYSRAARGGGGARANAPAWPQVENPPADRHIPPALLALLLTHTQLRRMVGPLSSGVCIRSSWLRQLRPVLATWRATSLQLRRLRAFFHGSSAG